MIDYFNLPNLDNNNFVFYYVGTSVWQTWEKPRGCKFIQIFVLGGGGGGGAGATGVVGSQRSGGAGGGSSAISRLFIPTSYLPDVLYINVGRGGVGGSPTAGVGGNGTAGELSYVSVLPSTIATNTILGSSTGGAGGGNGGNINSSNAAAGIAGTIFTPANNGYLSYFCYTSLIAGVIGGSGGNVNGAGSIAAISSIVTGGSGGAGVQGTARSGANITGSGFVPTINGGSLTNLTQADSGFTSFNEKLNSLRYPLFFTGGAGGYSNTTASGGDGGNGSYGSGGGGGGGGTTGGRGGNGGNGLVLITCW